MPRGARKFILLAYGIQVLWSLPLGSYFMWRWLAFDEPYRTYSCGYRRCSEGEPVNMFLALLFTGIGIAFLAAFVFCVLRWRRRDQRENHLRRYGRRAQAVVTESLWKGVRVKGRKVYHLRGQVPDMPEVRFTHKTFHPVPNGARVTVAYDVSDPEHAMVVDDLPSGMSVSPVVFGLAPSPADATIARLKQLEALRQSGALTEEEFARLKAQVLNH
jgi:hypothetical protein